jgi:2-polyprenyl-3-methyl-5-hydroxy-6-metoxy-1,4-benzoquinol methylase
MRVIEKLDRLCYPDVEPNWDDALFRTYLLRRITPDAVVLDLGAGAGIVSQMNFLDHCKEICGVDPDARVVDNPFLHEGKTGTGEMLPYADGKFDVVFCDNVMEHLDNPVPVLREVARVLKPRGYFLWKTPNKSHYVALIASLTPTRFHQFVNRKRGRDESDTFPTRYKVNRPAAVKRACDAAGLRLVDYQLIESRPEYLRMSLPTYLLGIVYERLVNSTELLKHFRVLFMGEAQKLG